MYHAEIALFLSSPNYGARVLIDLASEKGYSLKFAKLGINGRASGAREAGDCDPLKLMNVNIILVDQVPRKILKFH